MKKRIIFITLILSLAMLFLLTGCDDIPLTAPTAPQAPAPTPSPEQSGQPADGNQAQMQASQLGNDNVAYIASILESLSVDPAMFFVYNPSASGINVERNENAEIDFSNSADGYIMIRFVRPTERRVMVRIEGPTGMEFTYFLRTDGEHDVFPLSDGNGSYQINVFENVDGNRFSLALAATIDVELYDEFAPFLRPNQFVNFNEYTKAVALAAHLVYGADDLLEKVSAIFTFIIENIRYDLELAQTVQSGYVPDLDVVLQRGMGICFDYAALMTAMLRSQSIPTRLVTGYAGVAYHAWIDVWSETEGWIHNVIFFDGNNWELMDPTFAAAGGGAGLEQIIGDGTTYNALRLF